MAKKLKPIVSKKPVSRKKVSTNVFKALALSVKEKKLEAWAKVELTAEEERIISGKGQTASEYWLFWSINRTISYGSPIFTNDILDTQRAIDPKYALHIYRNSKDTIEWKNIELKVFWLDFKFPLPTPKDPKKCKVINDDVEDFIFDAVWQWLILDDRTQMFRRQFLGRFDAVTDGQRLMFVQKEVTEASQLNDVTMKKWDYEYLDQEYMEVVAKKEFLDGKFVLEPIKIRGQEITIGQTFKLNWTSVHWVYASQMRRMAFEWTSFFKKSWRALQKIQYEVIKMLWWVTAIVMPRRAGKTWVIWEIMKEEMFRSRHRDNKPIRIIYVGINKKKNKTVKDYILWYSKHFTQEWWFVWDESNQRLTLVEHNSPKKYYKKWDSDVIERAHIDFVGARDESPGVGDYADLIVIDECERIPKEVFDDLYALVTNEYARMVLISTLNQHAKKTWFYDKLIQWEKEEAKRNREWKDINEFINTMRDKYWLSKYESIEDMLADDNLDLDEMRLDMMRERKIVWIRYSWWQVERRSEKEKKSMAESLMQENYQKYLAEWEWVFPEEHMVFDSKQAVVEHVSLIKKYPWILFSYDVADEWSDNKTITTRTVDMDPESPNYRKVLQLAEKELEWDTKRQVPQVNTYVREQLVQWTDEPQKNNYFFIYDGRWVGTNMDTLLKAVWIKINAIYYSTMWWYFDQDRHSNKHNVWKSWIVGEVQDLFSVHMVRISDACQISLGEMETFQATKSDRWYVSYEASWTNQDWFVNSMLMAIYFILEVKNMRKFLLWWVIDEVTETVSEAKSEEEKLYEMYLKDQKANDKETLSTRRRRLSSHIY